LIVRGWRNFIFSNTFQYASPLIMATAAAQRTKRIRLGIAVNLSLVIIRVVPRLRHYAGLFKQHVTASRGDPLGALRSCGRHIKGEA